MLDPVPTDDWTPSNLNEQVARVEAMYADTFDAWDGAPEPGGS